MMIVSLFVFFNYILGLLKAKFNIDKSSPGKNDCDHYFTSEIKKLTFEGDAEYTESGVVFYPPVYIQRYRAVTSILEAHKLRGNIRKVVDFGCANISFFTYVKQLNGVEEYLGVDIDEKELEDHYSRVVPLTADYLSKRCAPLKVQILKGSVTDPDIRLRDTNVVVAIELIEHMYPDELNELPFNVFEVVHPEIAVFTTPNSDFNVLFPSLNGGFRHPDHKFEWTREQFKDWAHNLALRFPFYDVTINGIGKGPVGTEDLGCCSQIAIFILKTAETKCSKNNFVDAYKCINELEYPFETLEEKLTNTLEYEVEKVFHRVFDNDEYVVDERREISLEDIIKLLSVDCSIEKLKIYLKKCNKNVEIINGKETLILSQYLEDEYNDSTSEYDVNEIVINNSHVEDYWDLGVQYIDNDNMNAAKRDSDYYVHEENLDESKSTELSSFVEPGSSSKVDMWDDKSLSVEKNGIVETAGGSNIELIKIPDKVLDSAEELEVPIPMGAVPKHHYDVHETSSEIVSQLDSAIRFRRNSRQQVENDYSFTSSASNEYDKSNESCQSSMTNGCKNPNKLYHTDSSGVCSFKQSGDESFSLPQDSSQSLLQTSGTDTNGEKLVQCNQCLQLCLKKKHICSVDGLGEVKNESFPIKESFDQACPFVHRCHSLENVNISNSKSKNFRYSLNIDNKVIDCDTSVVDMELEVCFKESSIPSLTDTLGSHSKAPDSGYPNSVHDMELDLTPEQVDEIITETESSLEDEESSVDERVDQILGLAPPVVFQDNVENGDVANNNRDGEGNNMEGGGAVEEEFGFEGLVIEGGDAEAGQHESEDEGLYLSALDISNETLIPEESSSHDDTAFNSILDLPSTSSFFRPVDFEFSEPEAFPSWLLDISLTDDDPASGDHVLFEDSAVSVDSAVEAESTVPVDAMGGGEPLQN